MWMAVMYTSTGRWQKPSCKLVAARCGCGHDLKIKKVAINITSLTTRLDFYKSVISLYFGTKLFITIQAIK